MNLKIGTRSMKKKARQASPRVDAYEGYVCP
jgi:hypothetical protein